jgi:hypothetical protein
MKGDPDVMEANQRSKPKGLGSKPKGLGGVLLIFYQTIPNRNHMTSICLVRAATHHPTFLSFSHENQQ